MARIFAAVKHTNGSLPDSILARADGSILAGMPATLRKDAAAAWNRARKDATNRTGFVLGLRGWNRTRAEQEKFFHQRYRVQLLGGGPYGDVRWYKGKRYVRVAGAAAAIPGTSNHGWGLAIDVADYGAVGQWNHPRRVKTFHILREHGWTDTEGRGIAEPWHLVYDPRRDKHATKPAVTSKTGGIFGMSKHAKFNHKKKQTLGANKKYRILRITDNRSYIVAGPASFAGQINIVFDDLAPDQTAMIRVFRGGYKKGATPTVASGRTITQQEVVGTSGKTFATVPFVGAINENYGGGRDTRLYVQVKLNSGPARPVTVSNVTLEALHN